MPTYEYACKACGHQFEEIQKMTDPKITTCPSCGAEEAQRLVSQGNFILKGGGWYTTGGYGTKSTKSESEGVSSGGASTTEKSSSTASKAEGDKKSEAPAAASAPSTAPAAPAASSSEPSKT